MRLWVAIRMTLALSLLTGIIYPVAMVGLAHLMFPSQAEGSLVIRNGHVIGSRLLGQNFSLPGYFHGRPSAAGDRGYDATSSGGSNLDPTNKSLVDTVQKRLKELLEQNPGITPSQVPISIVTASGSGLDPDISPAGAELQVSRVAKARGLSEDFVRSLVSEHTRPRWAGILGEPAVNVLELNLALDDLSAAHHVSLK